VLAQRGPGVFLAEDTRFDVLCARDDVDTARIGCCGLIRRRFAQWVSGGVDERMLAPFGGLIPPWRLSAQHSLPHT